MFFTYEMVQVEQAYREEKYREEQLRRLSPMERRRLSETKVAVLERGSRRRPFRLRLRRGETPSGGVAR